MIDEELTSRFSITKQPILPAKCAVCGKGADNVKRFVDFGESLDFYGAILFCIDCAKEMARIIGFTSERASVAKYESLQEDYTKVEAENIELKVKLKALEDVIFLYRLNDPNSEPVAPGDGTSDSVSVSSESQDESNNLFT